MLYQEVTCRNLALKFRIGISEHPQWPRKSTLGLDRCVTTLLSLTFTEGKVAVDRHKEMDIAIFQ